jgi:hypothetical protein
MRLDLAHEAQRIADRINGVSGKSGRICTCEQRAVFMRGDSDLRLIGMDTDTGRRYLKETLHRLVGVYAPGVTAQDIADDLAVMA